MARTTAASSVGDRRPVTSSSSSSQAPAQHNTQQQQQQQKQQQKLQQQKLQQRQQQASISSAAINRSRLPESSPQIVENTLKEFHAYLTFVRAKVQQQCEAKDVQVQQGGDEITPWTATETKRYCHRLEKFQETLVEQTERFPLHSSAAREIMDAIQQVARTKGRMLWKSQNGNNNHGDDDDDDDNAKANHPQQQHDLERVSRHVGQMISHVSRLLQEIQLVDLDKLIKLMMHNQRAGRVMEGKDVLLLCGAARSGKTTTLHFLAGSAFEEVEVNGQFHLQPSSCPDPVVANYETSGGWQDGEGTKDPVTSHLQTAKVQRAGGMKEVVICDTPGLGHDSNHSSVEMDIANGLGMIRALHQARTVRPVLVINQDEVRARERFSSAGFDGETLGSLATLLQKCPDHGDGLLKPFQYVFTKYEAKHRDVLCRQFAVLKKNTDMSAVGKDGRLLRKLLEDIVRKTSPRANVALPLEEEGEEFLDHLWTQFSSPGGTIDDPKKYFVPFVSYPALKKLQLQLRITLSDLRTSLVEEDQNTAVYRLQQLKNLAQVLPEAQDCAILGVEAVKKHMTGLRDRIMASLERKDYSMAIHRSQQLEVLAKMIPDAERYGQVIHDAVFMLREITSALNSTEYETCQDRLQKLNQLAREFPEANKCAQYAMRAAVYHVAEFRERVIHWMDQLLEGSHDIRRFALLLDKLRIEMSHVVSVEPLLLICLNEEYVTLEAQDEKALKKLSGGTGEAFCIDQVQLLTEQLCRDLPSFNRDEVDMDEMLKTKDHFLSVLERLKTLNVRMQKSPASARAESVYHNVFASFYDLLNSVLGDAESMYQSNWTDLDTFGRQLWFVAVLLQNPLKNKPYTACDEHGKIEDLERRVLKMMLRLEIEVTRAMDRLKNHKFPECNKVFVKPTPIPDLKISELKAPRYLLISVAKNGRIRKLLPSKTDVLEINVCIAMFDHAMLGFWKKVVIRLEQDYAVIVQMQKVNKNPKDILQIAKVLRSDIARVEKEFLGVCGWSDDITTESEADLKRLIRIRDCVQQGVTKLEEIVNSKTRTIGYGMNIFACGGIADVSDRYLCRPMAAPE